MGGKGQRRREKNYRAAHGGNDRLPPPPKASDIDAIPSKLRRLIQLKNAAAATAVPDVSAAVTTENSGNEKGKKDPSKAEKKTKPSNLELIDNSNSKNGGVDSKHLIVNQKEVGKSDAASADDDRKGTRKRKKFSDLRFEDLNQAANNSRKKKRKEYLEAKKKKRKSKTAADGGVPEFAGREKIKFGEVVEAPPKLSFPKVRNPLEASQERIRLKVIEEYRSRRGWASRPGIKIPPVENPMS